MRREWKQLLAGVAMALPASVLLCWWSASSRFAPSPFLDYGEPWDSLLDATKTAALFCWPIILIVAATIAWQLTWDSAPRDATAWNAISHPALRAVALDLAAEGEQLSRGAWTGVMRGVPVTLREQGGTKLTATVDVSELEPLDVPIGPEAGDRIRDLVAVARPLRATDPDAALAEAARTEPSPLARAACLALLSLRAPGSTAVASACAPLVVDSNQTVKLLAMLLSPSLRSSALEAATPDRLADLAAACPFVALPAAVVDALAAAGPAGAAHLAALRDRDGRIAARATRALSLAAEHQGELSLARGDGGELSTASGSSPMAVAARRKSTTD